VTRSMVQSEVINGITYYDTQADLSRAQTLVWVFVGVAYLIQAPLLAASLIRVISDTYVGATGSIGGAMSFGLRKLFSVLWVSILTAICILGVALVGVLLMSGAQGSGSEPWIGIVMVVGIFFLAIRLVLAPAVVIVEDQRGTKALARSWKLVSGAWWKCFGALFLTGVFVGLVQWVIMIPVAQMTGHDQDLNALASILIGALLTPISIIVTVLLYFDARIRKEGLDLQYMARSISAPGA